MKTVGIVFLCLFGFALLAGGAFVCNIGGIFADHVTNSVKDAVIDYDQYQDLYNQAQEVDNNIGVIMRTKDDAAGFSKDERLNALELRLNNIVADYNAKSAHIDKKWWKSKTLPVTLSSTDFPNYVKATTTPNAH
jgi:hypothetical protein